MQPIELKDFLNFRYLSSIAYAPDGERAAFVVSQADEEKNSYSSCLYLYDPRSAAPIRQLTGLGSERNFVWLDRDRLLFPAVRTDAEKKDRENGDPATHVYCLDLRGGEALKCFDLPFAMTDMQVLDATHLCVLGQFDKTCPALDQLTGEARKEVLEAKKADKDYEVFDELPFWFNGEGVTNGSRSALYLVNLDPFSFTRLTGSDQTVSMARALGDEILYAVSDRPVRMKLHGLDIRAWNWKTGAGRAVFSDPDLMLDSFFPDDDALLLLAAKGDRYGCNENPYLYRLDVQTGRLHLVREETCSSHGDVGSDCRFGSSAEQAVHHGNFYFVSSREGDAQLFVTHPDGTSRCVCSKEGSMDGLALSEANDTALVIGMYDMGLQELYALSLADGSLTRLSHFNDACLSDHYVAKPIPLSVRSCGLDICGWVLLPKDYDPSRTYPAVLDIHGGPKCVYGPVYYHEMQLWASKGYFVFFCNPKGGDGRDDAFADIRGDYGGEDYQNLMDFTDAVLAAYPQIDSKRVCVTGGSYGGFMTNWIIGHTDRFCCAASQRSISNWLSFTGVSDIGFFFVEDQNQANLYEKPETLWDHSPLKYAAQVHTPTLFIHSDEDYRCPLEQGLQMVSALMDRGIPARLCLFHGENHELSRSGKPQHRVRRLKEITDWFDRFTT